MAAAGQAPQQAQQHVLVQQEVAHAEGQQAQAAGDHALAGAEAQAQGMVPQGVAQAEGQQPQAAGDQQVAQAQFNTAAGGAWPVPVAVDAQAAATAHARAAAVQDLLRADLSLED
jgi:hypothetical protein